MQGSMTCGPPEKALTTGEFRFAFQHHNQHLGYSSRRPRFRHQKAQLRSLAAFGTSLRWFIKYWCLRACILQSTASALGGMAAHRSKGPKGPEGPTKKTRFRDLLEIVLQFEGSPYT